MELRRRRRRERKRWTTVKEVQGEFRVGWVAGKVVPAERPEEESLE
jgi:hypothetical protein